MLHDRAIRVAAAFVVLVVSMAPAPVTAQGGELRMLIANDVACRAGPEAAAAVEHRYNVGDMLPARDQAGDGEAIWYLSSRDARAGSRGCWIYGPLTVALDRADPVPALLAAADHILARHDEVPFVEYVAVDNVLTRMPRRSHDRAAIEDSPLLQLRRLQVIERALAAPDAQREPVEQDPLKMAWMHAHADVARFFEPAGRWLMDADVYWRLFEEHRGSDATEAIAWAAAQGTVPGDECYAACLLETIQRTYGRYWVELPRGAHVEEAVRRAGEIAAVGARLGCQFPEEPPRARELAGTLRSSLAPVSAAGTQTLMTHLEAIERSCAD
jgi:hypothetical protein